nr:hypothetical protein [Tanacetum cinerariifolium]
MNTHVFDLSKTDLRNLVKTYHISLDLHPRLLDPNLTMDRLPSDAICIYVQFLRFSGNAEDVCMDKGPSSMKKGKKKLFLIYQRLGEMKEAVLVRSGLSSVWSNQKCDPVLFFSRLWRSLTISYFHSSTCRSNTTAPIVEGTPIPLPTPDEVIAAQPDPVLAKKSKASVKRKASTSLVIPSGPDQPTKKKRLRKKTSEAGSSAPRLGSPPRLPHATTFDPSHIGTSGAARAFTFEHGLVRKGVVVIGSSGKAGAEVMRCQLDPLDTLARNALARDEKRALDQTVTPIELERTESLLPLELSNQISVLTALLASHGTGLNSRLLLKPVHEKSLSARWNENRELRSLSDVSSEEFKKLKELVVRDLRNELTLEKSKSQKYRDAVVVVEHHFDVLKDEVTHFVSIGVECLVRKLLSSDEFNSALALVLYLGITFGFKRDLHMGHTDATFEEAAQNASNFFVGAKAEFDKAIAAFPSTSFPFLSKVVAAVGGALSEVVNIQPDKIIRSATLDSVPAAPLSPNEARSSSSTRESPSMLVTFHPLLFSFMQ